MERPKTKATILDIAIKHLSPIFAKFKGEDWMPVNQDAKVLLVKGMKRDGSTEATPDVEIKGSAGFVALFQERMKAYYGPVAVTDQNDIDDDTADLYNEIYSVVSNLYYDLNAAWGILDSQARSIACCAAIDNALDQLDELRGMTKGQPVAPAEPLEFITTDESKEKAEVIDVGEPGENGLPASYTACGKTHEEALAAIAAFKASSDGSYGSDEEAGYADPKNQKYPLKKDGKLNEKRVKAAWSYINMPKNQKGYDADELAAIKKKIKSAAKELGIEISDDKGAPVETPAAATTLTVNNNSADPGALAKAIQEAVGAAFESFRSEYSENVAKAIKTAVDAEHAASEAAVATLRGEIDTANNTLKDIAKAARTPLSPGAVPTTSTDGSTHDPATPDGTSAEKAAAAQKLNTGGAGSIGEAVKLARIANS